MDTFPPYTGVGGESKEREIDSHAPIKVLVFQQPKVRYGCCKEQQVIQCGLAQDWEGGGICGSNSTDILFPFLASTHLLGLDPPSWAH